MFSPFLIFSMANSFLEFIPIIVLMGAFVLQQSFQIQKTLSLKTIKE